MPTPFIRAVQFLSTTAEELNITDEEVQFLQDFIANQDRYNSEEDTTAVEAILDKYNFPKILPM